MSVVGILSDEVDPMVSVMKVEKAPLESYADIGGLHDQVRYVQQNSNIVNTGVISLRYKRSKKQLSCR